MRLERGSSSRIQTILYSFAFDSNLMVPDATYEISSSLFYDSAYDAERRLIYFLNLEATPELLAFDVEDATRLPDLFSLGLSPQHKWRANWF